MKVLIAEDDPLIRMLFKEVLRVNGFETIEAVDGEDALNVYDTMLQKPDIIVLDFRMPKIDGIEVTRELMQRNTKSNILMITGDPKVNQDYLLNIGVRFKEKPVRVDEFLSEIHSLAQIS